MIALYEVAATTRKLYEQARALLPEDEYSDAMVMRMVNTMLRHGYTSFADTCRMTDRELLAIHNLGDRTLYAIRESEIALGLRVPHEVALRVGLEKIAAESSGRARAHR